jgi:hypothetical protein
MAPKRRGACAEQNIPLTRASKRQRKDNPKTTAKDSGKHTDPAAQGCLDDRTQASLDDRIRQLPQELQDEILDFTLAASLPSGLSRVTISEDRNTFNVPLALKVNRKFRARYAEHFYRAGQILSTDFNDLYDKRIAVSIDEWFCVVDPQHRRYINTIRVKCSIEGTVSAGPGRYRMNYYTNSISISMENEYNSMNKRASAYHDALGRPWNMLSPRELRKWVCGTGLRYCLYTILDRSIDGPSRGY